MDIFENQAASYDAWFRENPCLFMAELSAVKKVLPNFENAVEIGAGTGMFSSELGIETGVEPSASMGAAAKSRGINIIEGTAEDLPLKDHAYDLALMVTADCFLTDIEKAFREIYRILTDRGSFVIAFLDRNTKLGAQYEEFKNEDPVYRYASFHSSAEICAMLQKTGFDVAEKQQTVMTLKNEEQPVTAGNGDGVFAVIRAEKSAT